MTVIVRRLPAKLRRLSAQAGIDDPVVFLAGVIDRHPTLDDAASELRVSRTTLHTWRRQCGITIERG